MWNSLESPFLISSLLIVMLFLQLCDGRLLEGIYCGRENCYDVLNVTRQHSQSEIRRAYRSLAKVHHPDKVHYREEKAKLEASIRFKQIATAYEILRDEEARKDYDYMLDNPSEYYAHYYRYYRRRMTPKVDVRLVLFVTITIISIVQYYSLWQRYDSAIKYFMTVPKYRNKAIEIAVEQQKLNENGTSNSKKIKSRNRVSKAEQKEEMDQQIRKIIEEKMDIKGAYAKPKISDLLWIQLIILPYTIYKYIYWYVRWVWRFNILHQPYEEEEKLHLIRKYMKIGLHQFNGIEDVEKQGYLEMELWIKENFNEWKDEQEEQLKRTLAESARHKSYRRYMKNRGPGRMTFED